MLEFLRKNKKALFGATAAVGLGVGGLGLAGQLPDLTDVQTDGLIAFVALGGGLIVAGVKMFMAKRADADKAPPSA